jgi:hypothetical protein
LSQQVQGERALVGKDDASGSRRQLQTDQRGKGQTWDREVVAFRIVNINIQERYIFEGYDHRPHAQTLLFL